MSNCAASVMDRTQDSGSCNVGSTPTWRILSTGDYKCLPLTKQLFDHVHNLISLGSMN